MIVLVRLMKCPLATTTEVGEEGGQGSKKMVKKRPGNSGGDGGGGGGDGGDDGCGADGKNKKGGPKNAISPFIDASRKKILVLLSASVERFGVSRMRDF